jgi:hypothetical protein
VSDPIAEEQPEWLEEEELPPRPRRTLLKPMPLALLAALLIACGFIGGVLVEKGQSESGGSLGGRAAAVAGFAARLRGLTGAGTTAGSAGGSSTPAIAAGSTGGASARPTAGTVAYLSGSTLYVSEGESSTVKVSTSPATTVTKTVASSVADIHPGESVTITGSTAPSGTVEAEAIRVGSGGGGLAALFGGAGSSTSGAPGSSAKTPAGAGQPLFGNG